jgi:DNA-binding IclR family transcriptional regulator
MQSVHRALTILDVMARYGEIGITEVAGELGVHKSTASRLVTALEEHGLVEQVEQRGKYRLGYGVVRLAGVSTAQMSLTRASRPVCQRLVEQLNETVNVAVLHDAAAMNIAEEQGYATVTAQNWTGRRTPLHATSSGKILLAWAEPEQRAAILGGGLARHTRRTITSRRKLDTVLNKVRERGWAYTIEELETGLNAVAAPIRDATGRVVAALSVTGPAYRLAETAFPDLAHTVQFGAGEISAALGYVPPLEAGNTSG